MTQSLSHKRNSSPISARPGRAHSGMVLLLFLLSGLIVLSLLKLAYFKQQPSTVPSEYRFRQSQETGPLGDATPAPAEPQSEAVAVDPLAQPSMIGADADQSPRPAEQ